MPMYDGSEYSVFASRLYLMGYFIAQHIYNYAFVCDCLITLFVLKKYRAQLFKSIKFLKIMIRKRFKKKINVIIVTAQPITTNAR